MYAYLAPTLFLMVMDGAAINILREAAKKIFLVARPFKRGGGGVKVGPLRKKNFLSSKKNISEKNMVTKLEGWKSKALMAGPLKKLLFCGFPIVLIISE